MTFLSTIKPRNYPFPIFFAVTCFLVIWFMMGFTDAQNGKIVCAAIGICIEIIAQIIYYYGRKWLRILDFWHILGSIFLFLVFLVYIVVFSIPSAITYFATTTAYYEQQNERKLYNVEQTKAQLEQVNKRIDALNKYLDKESETGYGSRSKEVVNQLSQLTIEQEKLSAELQKNSLTKSNIDHDRFGLLGMIYGMPGNRIMIYIFGAAVLMLYIGLVVTSPDGSGNVTDRMKRETKTVTNKIKPETQKETLCKCGCGRSFPKSKRRKYFEDSCRVTDFRNKKKG